MNIKHLKFLVDVGVSKKLENWLSQQGYDSKSVRDINPRMLDKDILMLAVSEKRMIITMDKDFGELVFNSGLDHSGVLLLRLDDEKTEGKIKSVDMILKKHSDKIQNHFCVFQNGKLRIRK